MLALGRSARGAMTPTSSHNFADPGVVFCNGELHRQRCTAIILVTLLLP